MQLQVVMMSTLRQQLQSVRDQLELGKKAEQSKHIISEYELIYRRLSQPHQKLKNLLEEFNTLKILPDEYRRVLTSSEIIFNQSATCAQSVGRFRARWESENHEARTHDELANAEASLGTLIATLAEAISECWNSWVGQINSRVAVEDTKLEGQKSLPGLGEVYRDYKVSREKLRSLTKRIPTEPTAIDEINSLCGLMVELKGKMRWDVDPEIAAFFDRLDHRGAVPLSLLSEKVLAWLREDGSLDQFVIQRNGKRY